MPLAAYFLRTAGLFFPAPRTPCGSSRDASERQRAPRSSGGDDRGHRADHEVDRVEARRGEGGHDGQGARELLLTGDPAGPRPRGLTADVDDVGALRDEFTQTARAVLGFMERLEDLDDVQNVYANFDIPADLMERLEAQVA